MFIDVIGLVASFASCADAHAQTASPSQSGRFGLRLLIGASSDLRIRVMLAAIFFALAALAAGLLPWRWSRILIVAVAVAGTAAFLIWSQLLLHRP